MSIGVIKLPLIALSCLLAVITIYTVIDVCGRLLESHGKKAKALLLLAGIMIGGTGITALHYVGLFAYDSGLPQQYDLWMVSKSLFLSCLTAATIFFSVLAPIRRFRRVVLGGVAAGVGYGLAHVLAFQTVDRTVQLAPLGMALWIVSTVLIAIVAFYFMLDQEQEMLHTSMQKKAVAALVVGIVIAVQQFMEWKAGMLPAFHPKNETVVSLVVSRQQFIEAACVLMVIILLFNLLSAYMDRRRAVQIAMYKNTQYESLFRHNPNLVCLFDMEGYLRIANPALQTITGYTPEEFQNRSYKEMIFSQYHEDVECLLPRIMRGETIRFELATRHKDGHRIDLAVTSIPMIVDEKVTAIYVIAEDITARKQMAEALRESEAKYRFFAENTSDLISVFQTDGTIQYASPSHETVLQYPIEEYVGNHARKFLHPEDIPRLQEMLLQLMRTKEQQQIEYRYRRKDGEWLTLESTVIPIVEHDGQVESCAVIARDVTKRKRAERQLEESEQRYRSLFAHNPDAVFSINTCGIVTRVNPAAQTITGYAKEEMLGRSFFEFISKKDRPRAIQAFRQGRMDTTQYYEVSIKHKDGHPIFLHVKIVPIVIDQVTVGVFGIATDVTERKQAEETINHMAFHDALTDLPNRRLFKDRLTNQLRDAQIAGKMLCIMFLDLDRFKLVNDTLGHDVGDRLLVGVAHKLKSCLRPQDMLARMGGDEFTILLAELEDVDYALRIADEILQIFTQPFIIDEHHLHITTSIGIAVFPKDGADVETLMKNADVAMYRAKEQGKNRYQLFADAGMGISTLMLENQLRHALGRDELLLHYQPQVDMQTGSIIGMEALIRWEHPDLGLLTPKAYMHLAEEMGTILEINRWALREACKQCSTWRQTLHPTLKIAVNLSARQFQQQDFEREVESILAETGLPADALILEIKESTAMYDAQIVMEKLQRLKRLGVQIAIDDFGTGYSSLSLLRKYPIDILKIDSSFVKELPLCPDSLAIVQGIISLAQSLKRKVVAEGVETGKQMRLLEELGCTLAQGYLFSHPLPTEAAEQLLSNAQTGWIKVRS